jgi:hypothetical protein
VVKEFGLPVLAGLLGVWVGLGAGAAVWGELVHATAAVATIASTAAEITVCSFLACFMAILRLFLSFTCFH